ncbi:MULTISPECIES: hypothetical protein [Pectobacterium]|uniref:hypothetical protein n=1 Tax=Pectobacterium TaxID=122277 RepID=UPI000650DB3C|nr:MULTISPECIES: hypothetical protein [Pectobacterium]KMK81505.1 hypothetical protein KCO_19207 [Pectobacterium brasiliense ICMP 19477]MCL6354345.1 hypothetical protein [Pectobacterium parmentieri]GKV82451.1 hypothetical protein PEC106664_32250 [Pectobacterium carotovorum subsp. carotovorum]
MRKDETIIIENFEIKVRENGERYIVARPAEIVSRESVTNDKKSQNTYPSNVKNIAKFILG